MEKSDIETGRAADGYGAYASPKIDGLHDGDDARPVQGASVLKLMLISIPRLAIQMTWSAQFAALGPYLGTMLPNYAVQLTQFIGPICGIFIGPTIGVFSDRSTNKLGRRRPFLIYASIASVICWILMGYTRQMGEALGDYGTGQAGEPTSRTWTTLFAVLLYAWMDITVNVVQTPTYLFIADFAGDRQTLGASIGQGWSLVGSVFVAGYIYLFGAAHKTLRSFLWMLSGVMMVTVLIACIAGKETPIKKDVNDRTTGLQQVKAAFGAIIHALKTLPKTLMVYCIVFFCIGYGFTAYNGNKGQFFGFEVYDGVALGSDSCGSGSNPPCTEGQEAYNKGVSLAGGSTDLMFNIVGYLYTWAVPFLVKKFGAKNVLIGSFLPQCLLMVMAFTKNVTIDVFIVVITTVTQSVVFALLVPIIVHVMGNEIDIGVYVGALNSAQCFGQLLNFAVGSAVVETSFGYKLPVFLGGAFTLIGVFITIFFLKLKMYSM
ncbi:hypothetical protein PybrP1_008243 [[Pythium] brassicae (nom. inval.)]|nr:hypothetical protein PybrP1_008243 [[Pythium] brassicae (nom. inval.)]